MCGARPGCRQRAAVWNTVQFAANGAVFVLLGAQMPRILNGAAAAVRVAGHHQTWVLAVHVLAIAAAIAGLRFVWVWISLRFTLFRAAQRGEARSVPSLRRPRRALRGRPQHLQALRLRDRAPSGDRRRRSAPEREWPQGGSDRAGGVAGS